jgi:hypothetical protein
MFKALIKYHEIIWINHTTYIQYNAIFFAEVKNHNYITDIDMDNSQYASQHIP